ncbi:MAG: Gfo/Idh/MocA family oxidoreductase [Oscillospiraceae bacterium]|nr:Gfo/Idh/MocA family oxidoreductase [Oscillospiraceae bacterium]
MSTQKKIRIGVVGTGGIARDHMKHYVTFDDVEIVGACDIAPGKARAFLDKYDLPNVPAFNSVAELIKNVEMDGASVCTYNTTHAECAVALLEAGIHVLCEKPMSFTLQGAVDMVRASRKSGKFLTIGFQPRYSFMRRKVDAIIESGALGKIYYVQSGGGRRRGIPFGTFVDKEKAGYGCLGDIGCYAIDECLHAIRYPKPLTVSAIATNHFGTNPKYYLGADKFDVDDFSVALVRLEGDVTFVFKDSWAMHADTLGDTLWLGTEGAIKLTSGKKEHNMPSRVMYFTDINGQHIDSVVWPNIPMDGYLCDVELERPIDMWFGKMRGFVDAVISNGPAPVPGEEILFNQAICDGIYRSSKLKKEVEIDIPAI